MNVNPRQIRPLSSVNDIDIIMVMTDKFELIEDQEAKRDSRRRGRHVTRTMVFRKELSWRELRPSTFQG
ncbi:hypothetical protein DPV78_012502 [Talaromyces pinophilus]|nr:hypothetical protein DPV78_012502 [Talaromyces pinophilus]